MPPAPAHATDADLLPSGSPGTADSSVAGHAPSSSAARTKSTGASAKAKATKKRGAGVAKTTRTKKKRPDDKPKLGMLDMVQLIATDCDVTYRIARAMLDVFIAEVMKAVSEDRRVVIPGFGTWMRRNKTGRNGINPKTSEPIVIPPHGAVGFRPGTEFRLRVKAPLEEAAAA